MNTQTTTFLFPVNIGKIMYGELKVTAERRYDANLIGRNTELTEILYQRYNFGELSGWFNVTDLVTIAAPDLDKELMAIACERFYELEHENDEVEDDDCDDARYAELTQISKDNSNY